MPKVSGQKFKMTQVWKGDEVIPGTVIKVIKKEGDPEIAFKEGDLVMVTGHSKGRGFQGGVKRHGFHGGPKTHGQKNRLRAPGSIGSTAPQRVTPGRRMAGHMGTNQVSIKNLEVVSVAENGSEILLKGAVPGMRGSNVILSKT